MSGTEEQSPSGSVLVFELGAAGSSGIVLRPVNGARTGSEDGALPSPDDLSEPGVFGIDLDQLLQVIEPTTVSPVPLAPAVVLGIMNFHGRIVTVVDSAPILGLKIPVVSGPDSRVLLLRHHRTSGAGNVGLYVSRVQNILPPGELAATDVPPGPCIRWVLQHGQRLINIVSVEQLFEGLARRFSSDRLPRQGVIG